MRILISGSCQNIPYQMVLNVIQMNLKLNCQQARLSIACRSLWGYILGKILVKVILQIIKVCGLSSVKSQRGFLTIYAMVFSPINWRAARDLKQIKKCWREWVIIFTTFRKKKQKMDCFSLRYLNGGKQQLPLPVLTMVEKIYRSASFYHTACHLLARCIHINVR